MVESLEVEDIRCRKNDKGMFDCAIKTKAGMDMEYNDLHGLSLKDKTTGDVLFLNENGLSHINQERANGAVTKFYPDDKRLVVEI